MKIVVPCTMTQAAIPDIFKNVPDSFIRQTMEVFESNASICYSTLKDVPGLNPIRPSGSMYIMVGMKLEELSIDVHMTVRACDPI